MILPADVNAKAAEVPLPKGTVEREQVFKPFGDFRRHTILTRGNTGQQRPTTQPVIGERFYYDDKQVLEETFVNATAALPPGVDARLFGESSPGISGVPDGLQRWWHKNGKLWEERPFNHGILDGPCRNWDSNGHPLATDEFRGGTGVLHSFYPDGRLRSECPYVLGRRHGVGRQWYPGGQLMADTAFEAGVQEGWSRFYHPDGRLRQEAFFRGGKVYGILREWDDAGRYTDGTPKYYIDDKPVSHEEFARDAKADRDLRRSIDSISAKEAP